MNPSVALECPTGCGRHRRSVAELLCRTCWYRVPADLRAEVWRAWRSYQHNRVSLAQLRAVQDQAIAAAKAPA